MEVFCLMGTRTIKKDDAPYQSGSGIQDHLQAKAPLPRLKNGTDPDDSIAPGFGGYQSAANFEIQVSQIPLIKWQRPPKLLISPDWQVVAGEESQQVETQNRRQLRELEAVYPRLSSIPPSPIVTSEVQEELYNDLQTPIIPVIPIEDEAMEQPYSVTQTTVIAPKSMLESLPVLPSDQKMMAGIMAGVEPDVAAAASAALTVLMRTSEQGSLINPDLLINILSNPEMLENLVSDFTKPASKNGILQQKIDLKQIPVVTTPAPSLVHVNTPRQCYSATNPVIPLPVSATPQPPIVNATPPVKDISYYKSLIQQHGSDRQEEGPDRSNVRFGNQQNHHTSPPDVGFTKRNEQQQQRKTQIAKPCLYFNTWKGCIHGANCLYLHDATLMHREQPPPPSSKRMKVDKEIAGKS
ncbi:Zinc finger CCCH domain-containing protein 6 [Acorus calamus]|uniref:Zinc finger CCCH domain-containing protein 6 n=1 Tax=Acorus calamus TaxID=4465 RepID=A0AAV9D7C0_ACOCL|nr:Zinc finger CCCH domain-containing protein 6 [Acorus calamus]